MGAAQALTDEELTESASGLRAFQMNLMALFGETWSRQKILLTARAAAISKIVGSWDYHSSYLPSLTAEGGAAQLENVPIDLIKSILARGRGLVIVTFHIGHMRFIPSDLVHAGIAVCAPFATDAYNDYSTSRSLNPNAAFWKGFTFVNVEERGTLSLARILAKGGCVASAIDGNTGQDGTRGHQRRRTVAILGSEASVKTGLFELAARFGSPMMVMAAYTQGETRTCESDMLMDPERPLTGADAESFINHATVRAYDFFAKGIFNHADEWCGGDLFHQWRITSRQPTRNIIAAEQAITKHLQADGRLTMNTHRILQLRGEDDIVLVDALSGHCCKLPLKLKPLTQQILPENGGVDLAWLNKHSDSERDQLWKILCQLSSRHIISEAISR